ncbi:type II toxin-antitoxin system VapC family toxin [Geoalkalibacter sp.]|uniref:type II toxin-antitoxin system VapC family toxin n=1 Tax=Geoalkalibacter sp. TaxID=3041440 RepID=UPI00272E7EF3|nr:PIN domain-containing protein [Geoalkalibacter sp.]
MKVLVDTSVWSLALRRSHPDGQNPYVRELRELINELRVQMVGPVRQELLSGVRHQASFERLRDALRAFPDLVLESCDFERAAEFFNESVAKGVQGSNTDFLLCALADRHGLPILTTDKDFLHFQKILPLTLHQPRSF